jgi:hypothetical protein
VRNGLKEALVLVCGNEFDERSASLVLRIDPFVVLDLNKWTTAQNGSTLRIGRHSQFVSFAILHDASHPGFPNLIEGNDTVREFLLEWIRLIFGASGNLRKPGVVFGRRKRLGPGYDGVNFASDRCSMLDSA